MRTVGQFYRLEQKKTVFGTWMSEMRSGDVAWWIRAIKFIHEKTWMVD